MLGTVLGAGIQGLASLWNNNQNTKLQKQFATKGIQWKVADAKKAGIHPMYALGAQTTSYAPQSLSGFPDLQSMGQSIDNTIHRTTDTPTRVANQLQLENAGLQNEYLKAQIASLNSRTAQTNTPSIPATSVEDITARNPTRPEISPHLRVGPGLPGITDQNYDDAQRAEDRYGESADFIEGPMNRFYDMVYRSTGMTWDAYKELMAMRARNWYFTGSTRSGQHYRHR